jgi:type IV secretion system protein TrbJ
MERKVSQRRGERMTGLRIRPLALAFVASLCVASISADAGTVAGTGGATEVTQLLNNVQLVQIAASDVQSVRNTLQTMLYLKQTLAQMDPGTISQMMGIPLNQVQTLIKLDGQLGGLMDSENNVAGILNNTVTGSQAANMTPSQYLQVRANQAQQLGGVYSQSFNNDRQQMSSLQTQLQSVQQTISSTPGITSEVQGLQQLSTENGQIQAQLITLTEAVTKANALAAMKGQQDQAQQQAALQYQQSEQNGWSQIKGTNVSFPDPANYAPKTNGTLSPSTPSSGTVSTDPNAY